MLNYFISQAQSGKKGTYAPTLLKPAFLVFCLMFVAQQIFAQDVVIIIEDVQGFHAQEENAESAEAGTYSLEVYQGTAPSNRSSLKTINDVTIFDSAGNVVYSASVNQKVIVLAESLFNKDTYEFLVSSPVGVFSEQLTIK